MKKFLFIGIFFVVSNMFTQAHAEDIAREEALKEFDNEVNGAKRTTETVRPLTEQQLEDARGPIWADGWYGDPFFGPGDQMDYELWRSQQDND